MDYFLSYAFADKILLPIIWISLAVNVFYNVLQVRQVFGRGTNYMLMSAKNYAHYAVYDSWISAGAGKGHFSADGEISFRRLHDSFAKKQSKKFYKEYKHHEKLAEDELKKALQPLTSKLYAVNVNSLHHEKLTMEELERARQAWINQSNRE